MCGKSEFQQVLNEDDQDYFSQKIVNVLFRIHTVDSRKDCDLIDRKLLSIYLYTWLTFPLK